MNRMIFGALVGSIAVALGSVAFAGAPAELAKSKKQKPAKLAIARVHAALTVEPHQVSPLTNVPCPRANRVVAGSVSPGATIVGVDGPTPGRDAWTGAVANPTDVTAHWTIDVMCAKAGNRYLRVSRGSSFVAQKRQYRDLKRALRERSR